MKFENVVVFGFEYAVRGLVRTMIKYESDSCFNGLHYFDWIKPANLECVHFLKETKTTRERHDCVSACDAANTAE